MIFINTCLAEKSKILSKKKGKERFENSPINFFSPSFLYITSTMNDTTCFSQK